VRRHGRLIQAYKEEMEAETGEQGEDIVVASSNVEQLNISMIVQEESLESEEEDGAFFFFFFDYSLVWLCLVLL
jgi:hypothetical protein